MTLQAIIADKNNEFLPAVKDLYTSSFPAKERIPFKLLIKLCELGKSDLLLFTDDHTFVGFASIIHYKDLVFIFYFAINDTLRGKGNGGKALQLIKDQYPGKRIILNIESTNVKAPNQDERLRRKMFYQSHDYKETDLSISERGETYQMLILDGEIEKEEYRELLRFTMGRILFWFMGPKITDFKRHA